MMANEFDLEEFEGQEEFIRDWWSPKKAFYGKRRSGKTTVLLCELNRFLRNDLDCLWISPKRTMANDSKTEYNMLFGKVPDVEIGTYDNLEALRGKRYDVVLMDELQETVFESISHHVSPLNPMFVRASVCTSSLNNPHSYLHDEPGFFDSVYRE